MRYKIIGLSILFFSITTFAQIGVYTNTPQAPFHFDGGKDNGTSNPLSAGQQANDFVLTNAGNVGIGVVSPSEKLDVGTGNVRIRTITSNTGIVGTDRPVVADANGVLKTVGFATTNLFHARLAADQTITGGASIVTLLFAAPLVTSTYYTYAPATGTLTFNQAGNYIITLQASFGNISAGAQLVLGMRPIPDNNYLARGSHYAGSDTPTLTTTTRIGELMNYTTMLIVPSAGYQIRFTAAPNQSSTILSTEMGPTGNGNVTNVTIQKI